MGSCVVHVVGHKFLDGAEHGAGTWDADAGAVGQGIAEEQVEVLYAVTVAEIFGEEGADDFTVLVAYESAADAERTVYHATNKCVKFVQHVFYSAKAVVLSLFCTTFAMSFCFFAAFELHH